MSRIEVDLRRRMGGGSKRRHIGAAADPDAMLARIQLPFRIGLPSRRMSSVAAQWRLSPACQTHLSGAMVRRDCAGRMPGRSSPTRPSWWSLRMQHLGGGEGESEDGDVIFLAEGLGGRGDGFGGLRGNCAGAVEAEELAS